MSQRTISAPGHAPDITWASLESLNSIDTSSASAPSQQQTIQSFVRAGNPLKAPATSPTRQTSSSLSTICTPEPHTGSPSLPQLAESQTQSKNFTRETRVSNKRAAQPDILVTPVKRHRAISKIDATDGEVVLGATSQSIELQSLGTSSLLSNTQSRRLVAPQTPTHLISSVSPRIAEQRGNETPPSNRRAKPSPGSPVWYHLQSRRLARAGSLNKSITTPPSLKSLTNQSSIIAPSPSLPSPLSPLSTSELPQGRAAGKTSPFVPTHPSLRNTDDLKMRNLIQVTQLRDYMKHITNISHQPEDYVDHLLTADTCSLFEQVLAACLMHSFAYRADADRTVWLVIDDEDDDSRLLPYDKHAPTHILALFKVKGIDGSVLLWGHCIHVGGHIDLHITFYDSRATLFDPETRASFTPGCHVWLRNNAPDHISIGNITEYYHGWPEEFSNMEEAEQDMIFCQLISRIVHELPSVTAMPANGLPVQPIWSVPQVQHQVRALLTQLASGTLSILGMAGAVGGTPECIYLHGQYGVPALELSKDEWQDRWMAGCDYSGVHVTTVNASHRAYVRVTANDIEYMDGSQVDVSSRSTSESSSIPETQEDIQSRLERQRILLKSVRELHMNQNSCSHVARLACWTQLKEGYTSAECLTLITLHLWLSAFEAERTSDVLYLDPVATEDLLQAFENDPWDDTLSSRRCLFDRHRLWQEMGENARIVVLCEPWNVCGLNNKSWALLNFTTLKGRAVEVEAMFAPGEVHDQREFNTLIARLMGALNRVLSRPSFPEKSSTVNQRLLQLVLPQPWSHDDLVMVMLAHFCSKILGQQIDFVNVGAFRQSVCYYFDTALRPSEPNSSFPWVALTDSDGQLITHITLPEAERRRFTLETHRQVPPVEVFPLRRTYTRTIASPSSSAPFFLELAQTESSHPPGALEGMAGRDLHELHKATLLGTYPSWPESFPFNSPQVPDALSLIEYVGLMHSLGGPEDLASCGLLLTGKHQGERLKLDWLKNAVTPDEEWLMASMDVDSLALTTIEAPELLQPGTYYPYPNRAQTLTNRNCLSVAVDGKSIEMHTCPNFCIMSLGANNQFRLIVFFPNLRCKVTDRMWRNLPLEKEMSDWYHTFLTALRIVARRVPHEWTHVVEKTIEAMPTSYAMAGVKCTHGGGSRSFAGHRIEPQVLNHVFQVMRQLIYSNDSMMGYRGYFFHLCGINLKLATQHVSGRENENPLNYVFRMYPFVDWYAQNPNDITVDVGLAINMHAPSVPLELKRSTLLFRFGPLRELLRPAFKFPQRDCYCHSYEIGGLRAGSSGRVMERAGVLKIQAYHKDMVATYRDRDSSIGANFTVEEALLLGHRHKFASQMAAYQNILEESNSFGNRIEWRVKAWAANQLLSVDPREPLDRLLKSEAIICHTTESIAQFKLALCKGWSAILTRQQKLPLQTRRSPEVMLMASVLAYWIKGLIKRPDDMSSSVQMARDLFLLDNVQEFGLPSLRSNAVHANQLQVSYICEAQSFKILSHINTIRPGGNTIKTSRLFKAIPAPHPLQSPPPTPARSLRTQELWTAESEEFVRLQIASNLPRALWERFPDKYQTQGTSAWKARGLPFRLGHWSRVVEPLILHTLVPGKFVASMNRLFPPNWTVQDPQGDYVGWNQTFLEPIRLHVQSKPVSSRSQYSAQLHLRIHASLTSTWEYLPMTDNRRIWTYAQRNDQVHRTVRIAIKQKMF